MEVIYQGHVATDGSTKIICTATSMVIDSIIINNPTTDYTFTFNRYMIGPGIHLIPIYEFILDAGDSIRDDKEYLLVTGNYIQFISDVPGTSYYVKAITV